MCVRLTFTNAVGTKAGAGSAEFCASNLGKRLEISGNHHAAAGQSGTRRNERRPSFLAAFSGAGSRTGASTFTKFLCQNSYLASGSGESGNARWRWCFPSSFEIPNHFFLIPRPPGPGPPSGLRSSDAAVHVPRIEVERIRDSHGDELLGGRAETRSGNRRLFRL